MKKITYESLICARNIIKTYYESVCDELGYLDDKDTLNYELSIIDELIEQHKPPTWEDVFNAWENTSDDKLKFTKNDEGIRIGYPNGIYYLINCEQVYSNRKVFSANVNVTLHAINLTIRYLENKNEN